MKALVREQYGSPDFLQVKDIPKPAPKNGEVVVRVHAASINDWDWGMLRGQPWFPNRYLAGILKPHVILGCDIAGRVEVIGKDVSLFKPGDEVYGDLCRSGFGGFAEYVSVNEKALALKSTRMTFEQAAAIPQAAMLAHQALFDARPLQPGQKILINGAGGGVGTFGIQFIRMMRLSGIEVTGVDSAAKLPMLSAMGFDQVIDYNEIDFTNTGLAYDLIVDAKTTRHPSEYARALNTNGIYATVGGLIPKLLKVAFLGPKIGRAKGQKILLVGLQPNRDLRRFNEFFDSGAFRPVIDGPYKLSEARAAFQHFGAANHQGKIVFTIADCDER